MRSMSGAYQTCRVNATQAVAACEVWQKRRREGDVLAGLYVCGLAALTLGVALLSVPAALMVGGLLSSGTALALARGATAPAKPANPEGDE